MRELREPRAGHPRGRGRAGHRRHGREGHRLRRDRRLRRDADAGPGGRREGGPVGPRADRRAGQGDPGAARGMTQGRQPGRCRPQCRAASGGPERQPLKRTCRPARVGAQQYGPAPASASVPNGATRTSSNGASSSRLSRMVTRRPAQSGTGRTDQSERPRVTTAPSCGTPSASSTPALIHVCSSARSITPAWSNWTVATGGLVHLPTDHGTAVPTTGSVMVATIGNNGPSRTSGTARAGGRYWDRTSDLFRVEEARYPCANRPSVLRYVRCSRWRRDSNPCIRLCRPLPRLSATPCLLYTSDAADEEDSVDLGGRRIIQKKKKKKKKKKKNKKKHKNKKTK